MYEIYNIMDGTVCPIMENVGGNYYYCCCSHVLTDHLGAAEDKDNFYSPAKQQCSNRAGLKYYLVVFSRSIMSLTNSRGVRY